MSTNAANKEVWILGATGRTGRAVAAAMAGKGVEIVLVGRNAQRLSAVAESLDGDARTLVAASPEATAEEIRRQQPCVVLNTIGPFTRTAVPIARACLPGGHYVDLANDLASVAALAELADEASAAGRTLVSGAGFGVLATESVVASLCAGRPTPARVRVDAVPSVETEAGEVGMALASTLTDGFSTGGQRYVGNRLTRFRLGSGATTLTLPSGETVGSVAMPTGDLHAAQRVSGAPEVTAGSSMLPTSPAVRAVLPVVGALFSLAPLRKFVARQLAGVRMEAKPRPRPYSWGHALVEWPGGATAEGWLRVEDAMNFTAATMTEVATRLTRGEGRRGMQTPVSAFGPDIAVAAGGEFLLD